MAKMYTLGQLRGAFSAGRHAAEFPPDVAGESEKNRRERVKAWAVRELLATVDRVGVIKAFSRDGDTAEPTRCILAAAKQVGGYTLVETVYDEVDDKLNEIAGGPMASNALEHRVSEILPEWPI